VEITIEEIAKDPLTYLNRTQVGESFVILKAGQPIAQISPIPPASKMTLVQAIATVQEQMSADESDTDFDNDWDAAVRDHTPIFHEPQW
jgi:antitoxin (DNA-binding transcriptional repressor) of toxin-antitoxin stability system